MGLHEIRYFLAVCETLNFTRAAERCHVTQPSLTRAIQNLEQELGEKLFNRTRNCTTLTTFGEAIRQEFIEVQRRVKAASTAAEGWTNGTKGLLRIGISGSAGATGIGRFLGAFQSCHEGIQLNLSEGATDDLLTQLERSEVDAALMAYPHKLTPTPAVRCLYEERLVAIVPIHHRFAMMECVPLTEFAGERVLLSIHNIHRNTVLATLRAPEISASATCYGGRDDCLVGMVTEGAGIAIMPEGLSLPPTLTARPLSSPIHRQIIYLLSRTNTYSKRMLRKLYNFADKYDPDQSDSIVTQIAV